RLLEEVSCLPAWMSFSCRDERHLCHGEPLAEAVARLEACKPIITIGVNCTAPQYVLGLLNSARAHTHKPLVAYPNSGESWEAVHHCWLPEACEFNWAAAARNWLNAGARLIGGCCRTTPTTIRALAAALREG